MVDAGLALPLRLGLDPRVGLGRAGRAWVGLGGDPREVFAG